MNIKEINSLVAELANHPNPEEVEETCNTLIKRRYKNTAERCKAMFLVSNLCCHSLNAHGKGEAVLVPLLEQDLADRDKVECLGRLVRLKIDQNEIKQAIKYHRDCIRVIEQALESQKKPLQYLLLWILCGCNNLSSNTPQSNLVLSYIYQGSDNTSKCLYLLKKLLRQDLSPLDPSFLKWKINQIQNQDQQQPRKSSSSINNFVQMDTAFKYIYGYYLHLSDEEVNKDIESEKKRVLAYLKSVYNNYSRREEYAEQLDFIEEQIADLEFQTLPASLYYLVQPSRTETSRLHQTFQIPSASVEPQTSPLPTSSTFIKNTLSRVVISDPQPPILLSPNWRGSQLSKINYNSNGTKRKYFYINSPNQAKMFYCDRKDKPDPRYDSHYSLQGITSVEQGKMTKRQLRSENRDFDERLCFSLIYKNRTRDFVANNESDFNNWMYVLRQYVPQTGSYSPSLRPIPSQPKIEIRTDSQPQMQQRSNMGNSPQPSSPPKIKGSVILKKR